METLRIVLACRARSLALILRDLVDGQPDMAVVGEVRTLSRLPTALTSLGAQAVILAFPAPETAQTICTLRITYPSLMILGLSPQSDRAVICRPGTAARPVEMSAAGLVRALRA